MEALRAAAGYACPSEANGKSLKRLNEALIELTKFLEAHGIKCGEYKRTGNGSFNGTLDVR